MEFTQDWIMRQIQMIAQMLAKLLFGKETTDYIIEDENDLNGTDLLYKAISELLASGDICGAEDLLFEALENGGKENLEVAIDFYAKLNKMTDAQLQAGNFSREEAEDGLRNAAALFGLENLLS